MSSIVGTKSAFEMRSMSLKNLSAIISQLKQTRMCRLFVSEINLQQNSFRKLEFVYRFECLLKILVLDDLFQLRAKRLVDLTRLILRQREHFVTMFLGEARFETTESHNRLQRRLLECR